MGDTDASSKERSRRGMFSKESKNELGKHVQVVKVLKVFLKTNLRKMR